MKEPIGVLHLVNTFAADGAVGQFLARLKAHPDGFRPVVACLQKAGPLLSEVPLPVEELGLPSPALVVKLAALMEREGVRIVHANDYYSNLLAVPAARMVRARVVCSRLDLRRWAFGAQRTAESLAFQAADAVMVNSRAAITGRATVVPNGIDVARFKPGAGSGTIAVVANLHAAKAHLDLIEAVARLPSDVRVLCAGEGPMRPVLEQQIAFYGLRERFQLLGYTRDVPGVLAQAEVACAPSHEEGLSTAILEAMAASLPVVATEVGDTPSVVIEGETGLLAPPRNPRLLAERLLSLLRDPGRSKALGAAGRKRVEKEFSLEALAAHLGALYRSVLDERRVAA